MTVEMVADETRPGQRIATALFVSHMHHTLTGSLQLSDLRGPTVILPPNWPVTLQQP